MSNPERQYGPDRPLPHPDNRFTGSSPATPNREISRFLGGSPASVLARLVLLSILVGVIMSAVGLDPWNIVESIQALIRAVYEMGFDAVRWVWRYFLLGAAVVIPIWLIVRLSKSVTG
jgi:hypothetical protein